jgi:hypothetical protein
LILLNFLALQNTFFAKFDRRRAMGTDGLKFFRLPPSGFAALPLRGRAEPDDELLLPVFRLPNHGARWT